MLKDFLRRLIPLLCAVLVLPALARSAESPESFEELEAFLAEERAAPKSLTYYDDGSIDMPTFDSTNAMFIVDTSGSMRDPGVNLLAVEVVARINAFLQNMPSLESLGILDGYGEVVYKSKARRSNQSNLLSQQEKSKSVAALVDWPKTHSISWNDLTRAAIKFQGRHFKGAAVDLYIFGEDYHFPRDLDGQRDDIALAHRMREQQAFKINVIRVKDTFNLSNPSNAGLTDYKAFDWYGQYLAYSTGGTFFYLDPPAYRQSIEGAVLAKIGATFPGMQWRIASPELDVDALNAATIAGKAIDFDLLVDPSKSSPEIRRASLPTVSLQVERVGTDRARCRIKCQSADKSEVLTFTAGLCLKRDRWLVYHWDDHSDPASPARLLFEARNGKR